VLFAAAALAQEGGWVRLPVDGKLTGWTRVAIPPTNPLGEPSQWSYDPVTGIILCGGQGGHDMLRYDREFGDFVLHVEWRFTKLTEDEKKYNSGVFVRTNADGAIWHQAQAGLAGGYLFGMSQVKGGPQRFNLRAQMTENRVKPAAEWNEYDITCQGSKISLAVNGKTVSEFTETDVKKGYIALEAEGFRIEFRNVRVKPL
jgi:hypothetical protein